MKILALDGALGGFSVALLDGDRIVDAGSEKPDALEAGLGRIAAVLDASGAQLADVDRLAVGVGPGSFTGVRIAIAYAKALALARKLPLAGISSYDILTPDDPPPTLLTVVHGRTGVISARLRTPGGDRTASGPIADVLEALVCDWPDEALAVSGNTEDVSSALAERGIVVRALPGRAERPARSVARLARTAEPSLSPHALGPDYGELPAAVVKAR